MRALVDSDFVCSRNTADIEAAQLLELKRELQVESWQTNALLKGVGPSELLRVPFADTTGFRFALCCVCF